MRKVTVYIAVSLDGCIADSDGKVGWLHGQRGDIEDPDTYPAFIRGIDTVVMGRKTWHQIVTELSPDEWVYRGLTSYVITHRAMPSTEDIQFVSDDPCTLIRRLRQMPGRGIWICGGADIIRPLVREDMIDEYRLSIIPTVLGSGVRLWGEAGRELPLELLHSQAGNGIMELTYARRMPESTP